MGTADSGYCPLVDGWGWNGSMVWPLPGYDEYRPFGFEPGGRHVGIDIYAPEGSPVLSPVSGVVVWSGWTGAGFGELVAVASSGRVVILGHLSAVTEGLGCGDSVTAGAVVGAVGRTGAVAGRSHVHVEVRWSGLSWDPMVWLD
jgi:murein DD-endopeptidase MepM/ murein hydrolase activator NlpD